MCVCVCVCERALFGFFLWMVKVTSFDWFCSFDGLEGEGAHGGGGGHRL